MRGLGGPSARTLRERALRFGGRPFVVSGVAALLAGCSACGAGPATTPFDAAAADGTEAGAWVEPAAGDGAPLTPDAPLGADGGVSFDGGGPADGGSSPDVASEDRNSSPDVASEDGSSSLDGSVDGPSGLHPRPTYQHLTETGLYVDPASRTVAAGLVAFEPTYKLWSDGLTKRRWIELPPGTVVDTSDMNHWLFPVGTKVWKEFSKDGVLLETRLIERFGTGPEDYWMGAFVWDADQADAVFAASGAVDILGTFHDAPPTKDCGACHRGEAGRILGFSALQLAGSPEGPAVSSPTLQDLASARLLSTPPEAGTNFVVPGDPTTRAALGYLHANCGHCHNLHGTAWPDTQMILRLDVGERDPATSNVVATTVNKALSYWRGGDITTRIVPGHPEASALYARMNRRGKDQMPPLATELLDDTGLALVQAWIASLTTSTGGTASPSPSTP